MIVFRRVAVIVLTILVLSVGAFDPVEAPHHGVGVQR